MISGTIEEDEDDIDKDCIVFYSLGLVFLAYFWWDINELLVTKQTMATAMGI